MQDISRDALSKGSSSAEAYSMKDIPLTQQHRCSTRLSLYFFDGHGSLACYYRIEEPQINADTDNSRLQMLLRLSAW